ncbi:OmpP1/FadL family transporter [Tahibacter amnicola]|uniref:Outer membrane protein transport protein n=1 Tax=Tahibacter amnicola TaxID=2976241 RepID=A0ABY6BNJ2_9GAMM|nr:outer membrane protein transport protein [Tahibacter amnicola]UXI69372.1 outer membrane protein transport protein [Tahibacter amnicola]
MKRTLSVAIGVVLLGSCGTAFAITDSETNASIPFSFSSPGARSLGMAGAFLGLADDATAAYANPAGLTQLAQTEISIEGRHTSYSTPYIDGGTAGVSPFSTAGLNISYADSSENNLSYLSIVVPRDRWAFAFYRHELARFETEFTTLAGAGFGNFQLFPFTSQAELKILNYGATAAFKATDNVSLGLGVSLYDFNFLTATGRVSLANPANPVAASAQAQLGDERGWGWNLGARFRLTDTWSLGLTYRRAPSFDYRAANLVFIDVQGNPLPAPAVFAAPTGVEFDIPDIWGIGLSWRPTDALVVNFDIDRVEYAQLTDRIDSLFGIADAASRLRLENGTEVHLGAEYTFANMTRPFSLRGGLWHDPRHSVEFDGTPANDNERALAVLFAGGRGSDTHYSIGGGWAFTKFQLDFAADFSEGVDTYSVSGVYRF